MKKSILLSSLVLSVCLVGMVFVSCKSDNKPKHDKEFLEALEQANNSCPRELAGGLGTLDAMKLEDENVTLYATYHQDVNPLLKTGDKAKEGLVMFMLGGNPNSNFFSSKVHF